MSWKWLKKTFVIIICMILTWLFAIWLVIWRYIISSSPFEFFLLFLTFQFKFHTLWSGGGSTQNSRLWIEFKTFWTLHSPAAQTHTQAVAHLVAQLQTVEGVRRVRVEGFWEEAQGEGKVAGQRSVAVQAVLQRLAEDGVEHQRRQQLPGSLPAAQLQGGGGGGDTRWVE